MKTIWLVNPYGPIEGENWREYSFNQFGKYLSKHGFNVIWWTSNFSHHFKEYRSDSWKDVYVNENFFIRLVPTNSYRRNIGFGRLLKDYQFGRNALSRFMIEEKPDVILAAENPMCMGLPAFHYANKHHVPIIYDQMDIWPEFLVRVLPKPLSIITNWLLKPVYKRRKTIYQSLDGSIALGKHYLEFMFKINPSLKNKPHALIYNGIDVYDFREHLNDPIKCDLLSSKKPSDEIWCVFAGTLGPSYDIEGIIQCARLLNEQQSNRFRFIIAGSGPLEKEVIDADATLPNFVYVGKLLPSELIPIYGKCDIGLQAYSAGSNVDMCDKFYDYTAAGLAIINSLTGEVSEFIKNYDIGVNYTANEENGLFNALNKFDNSEYLNSCKRKSEDLALIFDMNSQNEKLLQVLNSVI